MATARAAQKCYILIGLLVIMHQHQYSRWYSHERCGGGASVELVGKFRYSGDMLSADGDADADVEVGVRR